MFSKILCLAVSLEFNLENFNDVSFRDVCLPSSPGSSSSSSPPLSRGETELWSVACAGGATIKH